MTKNDLIEDIKSQLGGSKVNLEIEDEVISRFIDKSLKKIEPYINDTQYITKSASEVVDLSDENVEEVVRIYPNRSITSSHEEVDLFRVRNYSNFQDRLTVPYRISQIEDYINRNFKFDKNTKKLYIDDYSGEITIEVIKSTSVETLQDGKDVDWVGDYALALTKVALGRVRSKFRVNGAPYETDGQDLIQDGNQDRERLEQNLEQNGEGFFYVTR